MCGSFFYKNLDFEKSEDFSWMNLKLVLLGDAGVGKTALANQWLDIEDPLKTSATVGASFKKQYADIDGKDYCLNIWDTAGDERYQSTIPIYCRDAAAALIVFDLTRKTTFENVTRWMALVTEISGDIPFVLCGNKNDLDDKREITEENINDFVKEKNIEYYETSALTGYMVNEAFSALAMSAVNFSKNHNEKKEETSTIGPQQSVLDQEKKDGESSKCC